jgi:hypothetical protein
MNRRERFQLMGMVTAGFLVIVLLTMYPALMTLGPIGYGASRYHRARTRRIWVERVEERVRLRRSEQGPPPSLVGSAES